MLEQILEKINMNLERIAVVLEKEDVAATTKKRNKRAKEESFVDSETQMSENSEMPISKMEVASVQQVIPVNSEPEKYTQEEIARAMSSAMDAGRSDVVFNILKAFNTNSLMGINPNQYGDVARMLREAGIKI